MISEGSFDIDMATEGTNYILKYIKTILILIIFYNISFLIK